MLTPVADAIDGTATVPARRSTRCRTWRRAFDNGHTYADSKTDAVSKAAAVDSDVATSARDTKFTITGYSQGADAAGDLASAIGNDQGPGRSRTEVLAVACSPTPAPAPRAPRRWAHDLRAGASPTPGRRAWASSPAGSPRSAIRTTCTARSARAPTRSSARSGRSCRRPPAHDTGAGASGGGNAAVATALTSDFSGADLPASRIECRRARTATVRHRTGGSIDVNQIADTATSLARRSARSPICSHSGAANTAATAQPGRSPGGHTANTLPHRSSPQPAKPTCPLH